MPQILQASSPSKTRRAQRSSCWRREWRREGEGEGEGEREWRRAKRGGMGKGQEERTGGGRTAEEEIIQRRRSQFSFCEKFKEALPPHCNRRVGVSSLNL